MDYVKPGQVLAAMVETGAAKARLAPWPMFVRGFLGGAILGCATTLAFTAAVQTNVPIAGALIFPVGFAMIVLLGLELVTGSFALTPLAVAKKRATAGQMLASFGWALLGHVAGCLVYAGLYSLTVSKMGLDPGNALAQAVVGASEAKTIAYKSMGAEGLLLVTVKAVLCNWMVTLGAVLAMSSSSTIGKIAAMWLPILTFFGQGFEHAVVNLFVIPAGMMLGADVTLADWWLWNQIPVLIGNFIGGLLLTGVMFQWAQRDSGPRPEAAAAAPNPAEYPPAGTAAGAPVGAAVGERGA